MREQEYPNIPPHIRAWMRTEEGFSTVVRIVNETVFNEAILIDTTGVRELSEDAYRQTALGEQAGEVQDG